MLPELLRGRRWEKRLDDSGQRVQVARRERAFQRSIATPQQSVHGGADGRRPTRPRQARLLVFRAPDPEGRVHAARDSVADGQEEPELVFASAAPPDAR